MSTHVDIIFTSSNAEELYGDRLRYATPLSCAVDLKANLHKPVELLAGATALLIPTGIKLNMLPDPNVMALILPRSGMGHRDGFSLGNTVGLIDTDYQGEIMVSAYCREGYPNILIQRGHKLAQLLFMHCVRPIFNVIDEYTVETARSDGGFGSTGT